MDTPRRRAAWGGPKLGAAGAPSVRRGARRNSLERKGAGATAASPPRSRVRTWLPISIPPRLYGSRKQAFRPALVGFIEFGGVVKLPNGRRSATEAGAPW